MLEFNNSFWEDPRNKEGSTYQNGPQSLFSKLEQGCIECDELVNFLRDRMIIEDKYSTSLRQLADRKSLREGFGDELNENSSLKQCFDGLLRETSILADTHGQIVMDLQTDIVKILHYFANEHRERVNHEVRKVKMGLSQLDSKNKALIKAKLDYVKKIEAINKLEKDIDNSTDTKSNDDLAASINSKDSLASINDSDTVKPENSEKNKTQNPEQTLKTKTSEKPVDSHTASLMHKDPQYTIEDLDIELTSIILGPLALTRGEFANILKRARSELKPHDIKYGILGTLRGLVRGDELFVWCKKNILIGGEKTDHEILSICQSLVNQNYLRLIGRGNEFAPKVSSYYQWKKQALEFQISDELETTIPSKSISKQSSNPRNPINLNRTNTKDGSIGNIGKKPSWLLGMQPFKQNKEKIQNEFKQAQEAYKTAVYEADKFRVKIEEELMDFYGMMEAWELNRMANMKSAIKQYNELASKLLPVLLAINDRQRTYEESIKPEQDIRLLVESYGVGKFWPSPPIYHPLDKSPAEYQVFGVSLDEQQKISSKETPLMIAKSLSAIKKGLKSSEKQESYSVWTSIVDMRKVHAFRAIINNEPKVSLKLLRQFDLDIIASGLFLYLMELPDCLVTVDLYDPIKALYKVKTNSEDKLNTLKNLVSSLTPASLKTLKAIIKHIKELIDDDSDEKQKAKFIEDIKTAESSVQMNEIQPWYVLASSNLNRSGYTPDSSQLAGDDNSLNSFTGNETLMESISHEFPAVARAVNTLDNIKFPGIKSGFNFIADKLSIKTKDGNTDMSIYDQISPTIFRRSSSYRDEVLPRRAPLTDNNFISKQFDLENTSIPLETKPQTAINTKVEESQNTKIVSSTEKEKSEKEELTKIVVEKKDVDDVENGELKTMEKLDKKVSNEKENLKETSVDEDDVSVESILIDADITEHRNSSDMDFFLHDDDEDDI
ncbi:hypothetical protein BB558_000919 [Smittium angustum]|uniref:Rho-GAP domain-containing protein n=1 Tax=Smittium angustum TaxID=133377 RepID=A0A2U1JCT1_SMIAN|nr:hypothetical protein BB558_000919 [Smittium angustum]